MGIYNNDNRENKQYNISYRLQKIKELIDKKSNIQNNIIAEELNKFYQLEDNIDTFFSYIRYGVIGIIVYNVTTIVYNTITNILLP